MANPTKPLVRAASIVSPTGLVELRSSLQFLDADDKAAFIAHLGVVTGVSSVAGLTGAITADGLTTALALVVGDITGLQTALDLKADLVGGKIPSAQLPAIAVGEVFTAADQAAMLALTAQIGDVAIRSDQSGRRWTLGAADATQLASWIQLETPDAVTSVNGQAGAVVLAKGDIGLGNVTNDAQLKAADLDTDVALTANSDAKIPSQKAVKAYVDANAGGSTFDETGTYFFDVAGNDGTGDGSRNNPWATAAPLLTIILPLSADTSLSLDIASGTDLGDMDFGGLFAITLSVRGRDLTSEIGAITNTGQAVTIYVAGVITGGAILATGGNDQDGGTVSIHGVSPTVVGAITSEAGPASGGPGGQYGGTVNLYNVAAGAVTLTGGAGNGGQPGGNGGVLTLYGNASVASFSAAGGADGGAGAGTDGVANSAAGNGISSSGAVYFNAGGGAASIALNGNGVMAYQGNKLSVFASTTSAELASVLSDEVGTGGGFTRADGGAINPASIGATTRGSLLATSGNFSSSLVAAGSISSTGGTLSFTSNSRSILFTEGTNMSSRFALGDGAAVMVTSATQIGFGVNFAMNWLMSSSAFVSRTPIEIQNTSIGTPSTGTARIGGATVSGQTQLMAIGTGGAAANQLSGAMTANSGITIGSGGTAISKVLSGTGTIDFASIAGGGFEDATLTVTGAAVGDSVAPGIANASLNTDLSFFMWVSGTNTVTVRCFNHNLLSNSDPASGLFRATVFQH